MFLPRVFIADLVREYDLQSEFFTLLCLAENPQKRLRMGDVAAATALSLGAVTRVVKLLEGKGLVERRLSAADGRVHEAVLTQVGHQRLDQARRGHEESVRRPIVDKLAGVDLRTCTVATTLDWSRGPRTGAAVSSLANLVCRGFPRARRMPCRR